jgi:hypothetical protein
MKTEVFEQNRAGWVKAGYRRDMGSAIACLPPSDTFASIILQVLSML